MSEREAREGGRKGRKEEQERIEERGQRVTVLHVLLGILELLVCGPRLVLVIDDNGFRKVLD